MRDMWIAVAVALVVWVNQIMAQDIIPTDIIEGGSVIFLDAPGSNLIGNNVTRRNSYLPSGAYQTWLDVEGKLIAGRLENFYFYSYNSSGGGITHFRIQIWRPTARKNRYTLVWQRRVTVESNYANGALYIFDLDSANQFQTQQGDLIGWVNEDDLGPISFDYVQNHRTLYSPAVALTVGNTYDFERIPFPAQFSVAARVNPRVLFEDVPGRKVVYVTDSATFEWKLSVPFDKNMQGASLSIFKGNLQIVRLDQYMCNQKHNHTGPEDTRLSCISLGTTVGFSLGGSGVRDSDAGGYSCRIKLDLYSNTQQNTNASLYIYKSPTTPTITGNTQSVAGVNLILRCFAISQSLPESERPSAVIEYTWSTSLPNTSLTGYIIIVGPLSRDHDGENVTCTANEQGSNLTSKSNVTVSVIYPPGSAQLQANRASVVKGVDDLVMTCHLPLGEEGNPNTYTYQWRNPKQQLSNSGMSLTISKHELNADLHDGTWQCTPSNTAGSGTPSIKTIMVNAAPSLETNGGLSGLYEVPIDGDLSQMSCSFKAKPKADITWKYNGGTSLPAGVWKTSSDAPQGKYHITTGRLRWQGSDAARKASGGQYVCEAGNRIGQNVQSGPATLLPLYGPDAASLTPAGPLTINEPRIKTITCQADCSKTCSYSWNKIDNTTWSHTGPSLVLSPSDRADHGIFVCKAENNQGQNQAQIQVSINFPSTIKKFESFHQGDLISSNSTTLTCEVESRPMAHIQLVHVDSGTELEKVNSGLRVHHTLSDVNCFDSGIYKCISHNSIWSNNVTKDVILDVKCPPSVIVNIPSNIAEALNSSFTHRIPVVANPVFLENDVQWTFQPNSNKLRRDNLPDNVETSISSTPQPLVSNLTIHIGMVLESNFGTYKVTASNQYGSFSSQVDLVPEGPPETPSAPRLIKVTAVSLLVEWTAGFNGGLDQRFSVMYKQSGGTTDHTVEVPTAPGTSAGAVMRYKIQDKILSETRYQVRISSVNDYEGGGQKIGPEAWFTTKAKPQFSENKNPYVEFVSNSIIIHLEINNPDSVSHLVINICSDESQTQCGGPKNVTDLSVSQVVVPLPPASVNEYHIELVMYDGEEEVNKQTWIEKVPKELNTAAIVGGVLGAVLLACVLIIIVLLWRRGLLHNICHQADPRKNTPVVIYENVAHTGLQSDAGTDTGTPADTRGNANDTPVTRENKRKNEVTGFTAGTDTDQAEATYEELTDDYAPRLEPTVYEQMVPHNQMAVASEQLETDLQMRPYYENVV